MKISYMQLGCLLTMSAVFTQTIACDLSMQKFITVPVSTLIVFLAYLPLMFALSRLSRNKTDGKSLLHIINNKIFKVCFGIALLLRIVYAAVSVAIRLDEFITWTIMPYMPPFLSIAVVLIVALYGTRKGIEGVARAAPVALVLFLTVIAIVSVSTWEQIDVVRLYLPFESLATFTQRPFLSEVFDSVIGNDEIFFFVVLSGYVAPNPAKATRTVYYLPIVLAITLWLNFICNAILGRFIDGGVLFPVYTVATFAEFNLIERMDGFLVSAAIIAGILKITICLICTVVIITEMFNVNLRRKVKTL